MLRLAITPLSPGLQPVEVVALRDIPTEELYATLEAELVVDDEKAESEKIYFPSTDGLEREGTYNRAWLSKQAGRIAFIIDKIYSPNDEALDWPGRNPIVLFTVTPDNEVKHPKEKSEVSEDAGDKEGDANEIMMFNAERALKSTIAVIRKRKVVNKAEPEIVITNHLTPRVDTTTTAPYTSM